MKLHEMGTIIVISFVVLCSIVGVVSKYVVKKEDAPIEEFCEDQIKDATGYDIDLSPGSPE